MGTVLWCAGKELDGIQVWKGLDPGFNVRPMKSNWRTVRPVSCLRGWGSSRHRRCILGICRREGGYCFLGGF